MNTVEQVKQAKSAQDAMIVLAKALDQLLSPQAPKPGGHVIDGDPWGEWTEPVEQYEEEAHLDALHSQIRELEDALIEEADNDEHRALEAKLRLLKDELKTKPGTDAPGERDRSKLEVDDAGNTVVELPPVSDTRKEQRSKFAVTIGLEGDFIEHYITGGPLWLYYGDRDYVMGLLPEWRREMVMDVEETSPNESHEFGRDVLKSGSTGVDMDYATKALG